MIVFKVQFYMTVSMKYFLIFVGCTTGPCLNDGVWLIYIFSLVVVDVLDVLRKYIQIVGTNRVEASFVENVFFV